MIFSAQQMFTEAGGQTVNTTEDSTNVIDLGAAGTPYGAAAALSNDPGPGNPVSILVQVTSAITGTLVVKVLNSAAENLSSETVVAQYTFPATAAAGSQCAIQVLPHQLDQRYLGLEFSGASGGVVEAGITMGNQSNGI